MTGRTAIISGASRGIGNAVARRLLDNGWQLSLGMRRPDDAGAQLSQCHVARHDALERDESAWVSDTLGRFGRIDAVICCAGIMEPGDVIDVGEDTVDRMLEVNLRSPRRLVKAAWPALREAGNGRVILLASLSGKRVKSARSGTYSITKHGTVALAHGIRQKGWNDGIRATAICPGFVDTDMARAISDIPPEAMTRPGDVARLVDLVLDLPNTASVAELCVNCQLEEFY